MPLVEKRNPWHYKGMIHDSSLDPLFKKQYNTLKTRDFYNIDPSVIPMFVNPAKLYLYRYMRLEPYLHEMFNLDEDLHRVHPLHPSTKEVLEIINKYYANPRGILKFPLKNKRRRLRKEMNPKLLESMALFEAGESESESQLSPDEVTDWTSEDMESGSEQSIKSWKYCPGNGKGSLKKERNPVKKSKKLQKKESCVE